MFKNLSLGKKISGGFVIMLVVLAVVAFVGYNGLHIVEQKEENADDANWLIKESNKARMDEKNFMLRKDKKYLEKGLKIVSGFHDRANELEEKLKVPEDKAFVKEVVHNIDEWKEAFQEYVRLEDMKVEADAGMVEGAREAIVEIEKMWDDQKAKLLEEIDQQLAVKVVEERFAKAADANRLFQVALEIRANEKNYIIRGDIKYVDNVAKEVKAIISLAEDLKTRFKDDINKRQVDAIIAAMQRYKKSFDNFVLKVEEQKTEEKIMVEAARVCQEHADELRAGQKEKMVIATNRANSLMIGLGIAGIILGVLLAFFITIGITRPINKIIDGLRSGGEQTSSASEQVASSSQQMAEGASEQAASLEETSSSLEEMASMSKQNANNSNQAKNLMAEAKSSVEKGATSVNNTVKAMDVINESAKNISKIIKAIEEIAFQTNLLALNAAVEAARAGEHGKGFAVVADEVRSLAQRSAKAAGDTTELIETAINNAQNGAKVAKEAGDVLKDVTESSTKVANLVGEIAAASNEQSKGIEQVNGAVTQMDKVTQSNAANAEESASASEELSAQAQQMNAMVQQLVGIVNGNSDNSNDTMTAQKYQAKHVNRQISVADTGKHYLKNQMHQRLENNGSGRQENKKLVKPSEVIPLEDDDFKDF